MNTVKLLVTGMSCGHCEMAVSKALQGIAGVQSVSVSREPGEAVVTGTAEVALLIAAVEGQGYGARKQA